MPAPVVNVSETLLAHPHDLRLVGTKRLKTRLVRRVDAGSFDIGHSSA